MAVQRSDAAVIVALTPTCVAKFMQQPNAAAKLVEFRKVDSWKQRQFVEDGGWATVGGAKDPELGTGEFLRRGAPEDQGLARQSNVMQTAHRS